jgi:asparagine synthase (glutamine-hydrolysing)
VHRFICFLADPRDARAVETVRNLSSTLLRSAPDWRETYNCTGLRAFQRSRTGNAMRTYALPQGGCILGYLYTPVESSAPPTCIEALDNRSAERIVASRGKYLRDKFWGSYVGFVLDSRNHTQYVFRDCSGRVDCYYTRTKDVTVVFSDIADVLALGIGTFSINWRYVTGFLLDDDLQTNETGLDGVSQLLTGERLAISGPSIERDLLWDPRDVCREDVVDDWDEAVRRLKTITYDCIRAWAQAHHRVLLSLSGGLDSAIILGAFDPAVARAQVSCLNRYSDRPGEDEREFARLAATRAGVPLVESEWQLDGLAIDERILRAPPIARPSLATFDLLDLDYRNSLTEAISADATWSGRGGDQLFYRLATPLIAADYVHAHGISNRLHRVVMDTARLTRQSYWATAREAIRLGLSRRAWQPSSGELTPNSFLSKDAPLYAAYGRTVDLWHADSDDIPKGKRLQMQSLAIMLNRDRPFDALHHAEEHAPLLSQPLIEFCLKVPTYVLCRGGRQRALARAAFAQHVPPAIVARESKGSTMLFTTNLMRQSMPFIRELLLDGVLTANRMVDCKSLERHLRAAEPLRSNQVFALMACISAEAWIRKWNRTTQRAAA